MGSRTLRITFDDGRTIKRKFNDSLTLAETAKAVKKKYPGYASFYNDGKPYKPPTRIETFKSDWSRRLRRARRKLLIR